MRTGLIAQKMGMSRVFTPEGMHIPVTVLKVDSCQVVSVRTRTKTATLRFSSATAKPRSRT